MNKLEKPEKLQEEHLIFLDELRESGITNMFAAGPYLAAEFLDLPLNKAHKILSHWMKTFTERHEGKK